MRAGGRASAEAHTLSLTSLIQVEEAGPRGRTSSPLSVSEFSHTQADGTDSSSNDNLQAL